MKKSVFILIASGLLVLLASCAPGLGYAVHECSICKNVYPTEAAAASCNRTPGCPGYQANVIIDQNNKIGNLEDYIEKKKAELAALEKEIAAKMEKLQQMENDLAAKQKAIEEAEATIRIKEAEIAEQEKLISEKQKAIEEAEATIRIKEAEIAEQEKLISEKQETITRQEIEIAAKEEEIKKKQKELEEAEVTIKNLQNALGSTLRFDSMGFNKEYEVYPKCYMGRGWQAFPTSFRQEAEGFDQIDWDAVQEEMDRTKLGFAAAMKNMGYTERTTGYLDYYNTLPAFMKTETPPAGNGYRGYDYWDYKYSIKTSQKGIIFQITYTTYYEDWSNTSSEEIRRSSVETLLFQNYTSIICVDNERQIWVMKLVDIMDADNSDFYLFKELGDNEFGTYGKFETLEDAMTAAENVSQLTDANFTILDYYNLIDNGSVRVKEVTAE